MICPEEQPSILRCSALRPAVPITITSAARTGSPPPPDAVSGGVVPASAHGDLQRLRPGEVKGPRHVAGIETTHDHGWPAVDQGVEAAARRIEPGICAGEHGAANRSPQLGHAFTGAVD